ncbi:putative metalloprotease CJM1_0395 family protein [Lysinibacillus sp. NPDC097231]|uniref:putative metalloprotease CJM1_0395 family protein n=1 Tax=Lysinibacillus sp. NPDC097231 TaxID=3364142 RepID=UPI0037F1ECF9
MRLSSLIEQERITSHYNRKRILQRKEVGDTYRKNALYFQPKKNPLLLELENLLLGRKDQELYEQQKEESKEVTPQQQTIIQDFRQTEKNVREQTHRSEKNDALELTNSQLSAIEYIDEEVPIVADENAKETLQILAQVRNAALAPAQPSSQDLRVAASAKAQIQHMKAQLSDQKVDESALDDNEPAFVHEIIEVKVPERFSKELKLDPFADTIFGKSYEEAFKARTFKYASDKYATHIQMAKNGYLPGSGSVFSMIA